MVGIDMGSTSYLSKPRGGYRAKSGSSVGSDKEMNGKLRRPKIRRPTKLSDYGLKRVPDYTELAYKEAVSKLRYFLSGNYVPSVRSYGGSTSIKNLDESDGDLEKKYNLATSGYNNSALLEYKPRPRLTAKYATLYADSLKNTYTPQHNVSSAPPPASASAPPAAEQTGGTSPDVINFIQKQEEYIEQLERESQYCRDELSNLLGKVKEVISENEHLHEAQKNKLISRMFTSYGSETDEPDDLGDSTGLDSDNNKGTQYKSRKQKSRSSKLEGPNIVFESRIAELEAQLTQSKIDLKKLQEENNENKRKLASGLVDSTCLDGFKRQIDNLQRDKSSLEAQIAKLKLSLESKDGDFRRGNDVIESQLREERTNLEAEVRRLKEDLARERSKLRELAGEGTRRAIQERSAAEQRYNAHFDELQHDLAAQYDNVAKLQLELERQRREENDLKRELSMKNAAIEELKMELKNKTASLQADLAQAHAEKASLEEELASARLAIERHQRQAKHDTNRLNSEIQSLRHRLDRADADLVHSRRENLRLSEQIASLEKELNMKHLTPISPEKKKEKELSSMVESLENKHAKTVAELESMIQSQNSLMEKLTGECRLLTDKLDDANRRHKQELGTLQRQVDTLSRNMQTPREAPSIYQAQPSHQATASRYIPQSPGARPEHSRVDTSGNASLRQVRQHPITDPRQDDLPTPRPITENAPITTPQRMLSRQNSRSGLSRPQSRLSLSRQDSKSSVHQPESPQNYSKVENNDVEFKDQDEKSEGSRHYDQSDNQNYEQKDENLYKQDDQFGQRDVVNEAFENPQATEVSYDQSQVEGQEYQTKPQEYVTEDYDQQQYDQTEYQGQYENYEQYPQQYTDPNAPNYSDSNAQQYADLNAQQYVDPNAQQYVDPNAQQYVDPNAQQYVDPNAQQYVDPNAQQYVDPNAQQYVDPNAQYGENYENYSTDQRYKDNADYNQGYTPQYQQPQVPEPVSESKRSNSPNEKVASQS